MSELVKNLRELERDLSQFAGLTVGSIRIDLNEVRAIVGAAARIEQLESELREARRQAFEEAAKIVEKQAEIFASDEYAIGQPLSSFAERFACSQIAAALRAHSPRQSTEEGEAESNRVDTQTKEGE